MAGRRDGSRGAVAVEAALIIPVLLLLVFGIIDFGRAFSAKNALTHATREGVRVYAVTQDHSSAVDALLRGATGLDLADLEYDVPADGACDTGDPVQVSATYHFDFVALPFASIDIGSDAVMRCGG